MLDATTINGLGIAFIIGPIGAPSVSRKKVDSLVTLSLPRAVLTFICTNIPAPLSCSSCRRGSASSAVAVNVQASGSRFFSVFNCFVTSLLSVKVWNTNLVDAG